MSNNTENKQRNDKNAVTPLDLEQMHAAVRPAERSPDFVDRPERFSAHIIVNIRKFRWTSFLSVDATLLDLSTGGVKCRLPAKAKGRNGDKVWVCIQSVDGKSQEFRAQAVTKWVSGDGTMIGAEFLSISDEDRKVISGLIEHFKKLGRRAQ